MKQNIQNFYYIKRKNINCPPVTHARLVLSIALLNFVYWVPRNIPTYLYAHKHVYKKGNTSRFLS